MKLAAFVLAMLVGPAAVAAQPRPAPVAFEAPPPPAPVGFEAPPPAPVSVEGQPRPAPIAVEARPAHAPVSVDALPRPILQPDLSLATTFEVQLERTALPVRQYYPDNYALIAIPRFRAHVRPLGALFSLSVPVVYENTEPRGPSAGFGNLSIAGLLVRHRRDDLTFAVGADWTFPTANTPEAAYLSSSIILDSARHFAAGHVGHVHVDGQWRPGPVTLQAQVGLEHYLIADWWDQTLLRVSVAGIFPASPRVDFIAEGTLLSDVLDEEYNEDLDVVGGVAIGARLRSGIWSFGTHAKLHLGYDEYNAVNPVLALGADVTRPLSW